MQTKLTVPGNCEILRELNETPLEYGSLHGKNQDRSWKPCVKQIFDAKHLELGKQNIRLIATNLLDHH